MPDDEFADGLVLAIPHLRAFAISLHGNLDRADDLVQETLERALKARDQFTEGTNLRAWLFTILRNAFYTHHRRRRYEAEDVDGILANGLACEPSQIVSIEVSECIAALAQLPADQREALLLVTTQELDYAQAAAVCNCSVGTVKSRVSRARTRLAELMHRDRETGEPNELPARKVRATRSPRGVGMRAPSRAVSGDRTCRVAAAAGTRARSAGKRPIRSGEAPHLSWRERQPIDGLLREPILRQLGVPAVRKLVAQRIEPVRDRGDPGDEEHAQR